MGRLTALTSTVKKQLKLLAIKGFTDEEMAEVVGVSARTIYNWQKAHPGFFQTVKNLKAESDQKVEASLYERACGYSHPEDKVFNNNGEPLVVPTTKHYPPDATSMIFWLKNRQPKKWRDQKVIEGDEDSPINITVKVEGGEEDC